MVVELLQADHRPLKGLTLLLPEMMGSGDAEGLDHEVLVLKGGGEVEIDLEPAMQAVNLRITLQNGRGRRCSSLTSWRSRFSI